MAGQGGPAISFLRVYGTWTRIDLRCPVWPRRSNHCPKLGGI